MHLDEQLRTARKDHELLRSVNPVSTNLAAKAAPYRRVRAALEAAWSAGEQPGAAERDEVRRAVRMLMMDAEYFAGLNDSEGYRNPNEVWSTYERLEGLFASVS